VAQDVQEPDCEQDEQAESHFLQMDPLKYYPTGQLSKQELSDNLRSLLQVRQDVLVASVQLPQVVSHCEH
jgi:hypothetical protein